MSTALITYLSIGGLTLDLVGAAFLAVDVLTGPERRSEASLRREGVERVKETHARHERSLLELAGSTDPSEARLRALIEALDETLEEIRNRQQQQAQRSHTYALIGIALLMAGFLCQGIGTVLTTIASTA